MKHNTGEISTQKRYKGRPRKDIRHSLAMYLSNLGPWDESLSLWFEAERAFEYSDHSEDGGNSTGVGTEDEDDPDDESDWLSYDSEDHEAGESDRSDGEQSEESESADEDSEPSLQEE